MMSEFPDGWVEKMAQKGLVQHKVFVALLESLGLYQKFNTIRIKTGWSVNEAVVEIADRVEDHSHDGIQRVIDSIIEDGAG